MKYWSIGFYAGINIRHFNSVFVTEHSAHIKFIGELNHLMGSLA